MNTKCKQIKLKHFFQTLIYIYIQMLWRDISGQLAEESVSLEQWVIPNRSAGSARQLILEIQKYGVEIDFKCLQVLQVTKHHMAGAKSILWK